MCKLAYFRTPCTKQDLLTVFEYIDSNIVDSYEWSFSTAEKNMPVFSFLPVLPSFEISAGKYIYIIFDNEEDAINLAGKVKSGSMVLPESSEPCYYFIMRVE